MIITTLNNTFLSPFNAKLIDRQFTSHEVVNVNDWLEGSHKPIFFREYSRYKNLSLTFLINAGTDATMESNFSALVEFFKFATIKFEDMDKYFDVHLEGTTSLEKLKDGVAKFTVDLLCHKTYGLEKITHVSNVVNVNLMNWGDMKAPINIEITPLATVSQLEIQGLTKLPLKLNYLNVGNVYLVDSVNYKYTNNGINEIFNFDSFEFPFLPKDGANVMLSDPNVDIKFIYQPRFN